MAGKAGFRFLLRRGHLRGVQLRDGGRRGERGQCIEEDKRHAGNSVSHVDQSKRKPQKSGHPANGVAATVWTSGGYGSANTNTLLPRFASI